jgi:hypothetical protein
MRDRIRAWSRRTFFDPEPVLIALRNLELSLRDQPIPELVRRLRTNNLKDEREARDAAIFAHGMAAVCRTKILLSPGEAEDCDFITKAMVVDSELYSCVQLKELAPEDLSPTGTLEPLVEKLQRLPKSDAVLAVHLNRRISIPLVELAAIKAPFAEVWFFWAADPGLNEWRLFGDVLQNPSVVKFTYPS